MHDKTLDDIKLNLRPKFSISGEKKICIALSGTKFWPGFVGLNPYNINILLQALSKVEPVVKFCVENKPP